MALSIWTQTIKEVRFEFPARVQVVHQLDDILP
jgi:hypothetical protein